MNHDGGSLMIGHLVPAKALEERRPPFWKAADFWQDVAANIVAMVIVALAIRAIATSTDIRLGWLRG